MKKYFVKYLPTYAEPKQGDLCFHPEYGLGRFNGRNPMGYIHWDAARVLFGDRYPQSKRNEINFNEKCDSLKKAELFLCSTDIEIGDKIQHKKFSWADNGREFLHQHEWTVIREGENNLSDKPDLNTKLHIIIGSPTYFDNKEIDVCGWDIFKVMGKISPLATWIKDFMEIDAADAKFYNKYNGTNYPPDLYYVIKCPTCGIFH